MKNILGVDVPRLATVFLTCVLFQGVCFAQNDSGAVVRAQPATSGSQPGATAVPAEVLKELEAMKARIAELEAQLKSMKTVEPVNTAVVNASASSPASADLPTGAAVPATAIARTVSTAKKAGEKAA